MKISVIGAGYAGLVTGACLAEMGNDVLLVDIDKAKLDLINHKKSSPIYEEGLDELLGRVNIRATHDYRLITDSDFIFICVGTLSDENNTVILDQVFDAAQAVAKALADRSDYYVVVLKSTVVPGTTEQLLIPALENSGKKAGKDFGVCMSPEFLREGKAVFDALHPTRIVIGEQDKKAGDRLLTLYGSLNTPVVRTGLKAAEMIKLASNAFLAAKISFINEIGNICKPLGIDTYEVADAMGLDDRIGPKFLNSGIGFGGSCLPKDLRLLIASAGDNGYDPGILKEILRLNDSQALKPVELLKKYIEPASATVGVLGLAFKPGTDDVRDSRAIRVVETLLAEGAAVNAYDPLAIENFKKIFPGIGYGDAAEVMKCDAVLILTEWPEFNNLDYSGKIVIDGRNVPKAREARIYEGVCW